MKQLTVKQLKAKHKRERKARKREFVKNALGYLLLVVLMAGFIELGLRAWEKEMDIQTQKNIEWQMKYGRN